MTSGSLRKRLMVLAALTIIATLAAAGTALIFVFEQHVLKRVANDLELRSTELAKAFEIDTDGVPFLNHDMADPRYQRPYGGAYWQISEGDAQHLRSRSLWDEVLNTATVPAKEKTDGAFEIEGPGQSELYVIERAVTLHHKEQARHFQLVVALDHEDVKGLRHAFTMDVAKILILLALLLGGGAWLQLRFGLMPLKALRTSLNAVREGRLPRLQGAFPREVAPLSDDLNILLDRQDDLVRKARDRAGALAHGLKTPLTILTSEIARLEKAGMQKSADTLREQCLAIRGHVERELARARTHGAVEAVGLRTHIRPIVERLVDLMQRVETDRVIDWTIAISQDAQAEMEAADFAEVAGNLIDNARKWAHSSVKISTELHDGHLYFAVTDDGPGVPDGQHDAVLQKGVHFGRENHNSTGLGLAIVADTLAEYGQDLILTNRQPGCQVSFLLDAHHAKRQDPNRTVPKKQARASEGQRAMPFPDAAE